MLPSEMFLHAFYVITSMVCCACVSHSTHYKCFEILKILAEKMYYHDQNSVDCSDSVEHLMALGGHHILLVGDFVTNEARIPHARGPV